MTTKRPNIVILMADQLGASALGAYGHPQVKTPNIDTLVARIIPEPSTAVAEFESGTVDILYVPEDQTRAWEETDARQARLTQHVVHVVAITLVCGHATG